MGERGGDDAKIDHLGRVAFARQQPFALTRDRARVGRAHPLGHAVADQQDPPPAARRIDREIRPAKAVEVQVVNLRKTVGLAFDEQSIVNEPPLEHPAELRVALRRHLVVDAIEAPDLGQRKELAKKKLLSGRDQGQGDRGEEHEILEARADASVSAVRLGVRRPDPLKTLIALASAPSKWLARIISYFISASVHRRRKVNSRVKSSRLCSMRGPDP